MRIATMTIVSAILGVAFWAVLLFPAAGTLDYWQAWVFIALFSAATLIPSALLAVRHPDAMRRRMEAGPGSESRPVQKFLIVGTIVMAVAVTVVSALDHRFGWSSVPVAVIVIGDILVVIGLAIAQLVVFQNNYAAANVRVEEGQTVASTGLYSIVRHPMYFGATVMMIGLPPALGSYWGLLALVPGIAILRLRILDEEKLLREELDGYLEYADKVHYRLMPYVW
jgi:protein-S-isoprenylcysteine O-methyltransferase Ste14